jgi:hypothetical protein
MFGRAQVNGLLSLPADCSQCSGLLRIPVIRLHLTAVG